MEGLGFQVFLDPVLRAFAAPPRGLDADRELDGLGYSDHGAQMSTLIGQVLADLAMGRRDTNPLDGLDWPAIPAHSGKPWFLPLVGLWFGLKDRLS